MATGTLVMAALLLVGDVPPDVVAMNNRNFQIPIHIDAAQRDKVKELLLFASTDQGLTWNQVAVASPDKDAFVFYAPTDGLYWFNICVVDPQGNREPADIYKSPPRQKVLVDTLKPNLRITTAERQGDEVAVAWEIQEDHPDLNTLKLEYRTPDAPTWMWYSAAVTPTMIGQGRFRFLNSGPVFVRVQVADLAGNLSVVQTQVPGKQGELASSAAVPAAGQNSPSVPAPPPTNPAASMPQSAAPQPPPITPQPERMPAIQPASLTQTAPLNPQQAYQTPMGGAMDSRSAASMASGMPAAAPVPERPWTPPPGASYPQQGGYVPDPVGQQVATTAYAGNTYSTVGAASWPRPPAGPAQITNSTQITLDYEVSKVGPSGVGSVELYLTQDEGHTWQRYADDPKLKPPMTVNLPGEGVFGLRLVVRSRAGLGQRPPQSGDLPQMRVEVDTTPPVAKLFPPQPDPRRRDALLLTWNASDHNLAPNPITLQWSERPDGPWQMIAADVTNSGRYTWTMSQNLPYRVYLRLLARDAAGNVGMDQTSEPVLIDLQEPEGQIKGLIGVARRP